MPNVSCLRALCIALPFFVPTFLYAQAQTLIENDQVRVLKAVDKPHVKNPAHGHKLNRVMVYLGAGTQEIAPEGGKAETVTLKKGEVQFNKAVSKHTSEVTSDEPLTIIEVRTGRSFSKLAKGRIQVSARDAGVHIKAIRVPLAITLIEEANSSGVLSLPFELSALDGVSTPFVIWVATEPPGEPVLASLKVGDQP